MTLKITIPSGELYDEEENEFIYLSEVQLELEHSLYSISKWESVTEKSFFVDNITDINDSIEYIKCMTITPDISPDVYNRLTLSNFNTVNEYINAPMSATRLSELQKSGGTSGNRDRITSELIYYWMIVCNIPFECDKWHFNRLLALIEICNIKNTPPEKLSEQEFLSKRAAINEERKRKYNTKG